MTKRTKPKATQTAAPTINSTAPVSSIESIKAGTNTVATPKPKRANSKATAKPRGRPKKVAVEPKVEINLPAPVSKAIDVDSRTITYWEKQEVTPTPSLYSRFKDWLVFKLYYYTSYFRGF